MEEIVHTSESHHQKNYLARVNKWYNQKQKLIDEDLLKKRMPPSNLKPTITNQLEFRKQLSMKKREELEKDKSPIKRIKIEKSPLNKTRFPPIRKTTSNLSHGGESPYK